jgi:CxC2 like cysteine cluster associated with KDZ transposases
MCSNPAPAYNNDFVVIALNGIHEISLDYCGCGQATSRTSQLLQARLFPSTVIDPKTAATFSVLEHFQLLSFTSKISGFEFYRALARITNNIGVSPPPASYFC